jgi:hypothetical protein
VRLLIQRESFPYGKENFEIDLDGVKTEKMNICKSRSRFFLRVLQRSQP